MLYRLLEEKIISKLSGLEKEKAPEDVCYRDEDIIGENALNALKDLGISLEPIPVDFGKVMAWDAVLNGDLGYIERTYADPETDTDPLSEETCYPISYQDEETVADYLEDVIRKDLKINEWNPVKITVVSGDGSVSAFRVSDVMYDKKNNCFFKADELNLVNDRDAVLSFGNEVSDPDFEEDELFITEESVEIDTSPEDDPFRGSEDIGTMSVSIQGSCNLSLDCLEECKVTDRILSKCFGDPESLQTYTSLKVPVHTPKDIYSRHLTVGEVVDLYIADEETAKKLLDGMMSGAPVDTAWEDLLGNPGLQKEDGLNVG